MVAKKETAEEVVAGSSARWFELDNARQTRSLVRAADRPHDGWVVEAFPRGRAARPT